jgi:hypothetical protein
MFTPKFNYSLESGDIISYAKFFFIHNMTFTLLMHEPNKWTASTKTENFSVVTSFASGPEAALRELHQLVRPMIKEVHNA